MSILETKQVLKESLEEDLLEQVAKVLKVPVEVILYIELEAAYSKNFF